MKEAIRWIVLATVAVWTLMHFGGCFADTEPTTKKQVCAEYEELAGKVLRANGFIDNAVFHQAGRLGDVAGRYEGTRDLSDNAERLAEISESDETNGLELQEATGDIADLCGSSLFTAGLR